ncbi:MAG: DUF4256 domain-containing protein [Bryobacter sp.]|nr:DUF4256 domain-containing protein [Bryobacter sp.]
MTRKLNQRRNAALLSTLEARFAANRVLHAKLPWPEVKARLEAAEAKLWSLAEMEQSGGEPDVVGEPSGTGEVVFYDCSPESPSGRRSLCYDAEALAARKLNKPAGSALALAQAMGVALLSETQYRFLQEFGKFDQKTSSWIQTPPAIRELGGALFCDRRYETVFVYHNGAESYYAARGFRACLTV